MKHIRSIVLASYFLGLFSLSVAAEKAVTLEKVDVACDITVAGKCPDLDAIVFVHGIWGSNETFLNTTTNFDFVNRFPRTFKGLPNRKIDIFRLNYTTEMLTWAKRTNGSFKSVAKAVFEEMKPLRRAEYRTIGFIAHSLGGNVVATYITLVNEQLGHPQRAQNGFVITLGTPVVGVQIADMASWLKSVLGMSDPLLESLKKDNLYLEMLNEFRASQGVKGDRNGCRSVRLHAAIEDKYLNVVAVVGAASSEDPIRNITNDVRAFSLDHIALAKPADVQSPIYKWVIKAAEQDLSDIDLFHLNNGPQYCKRIPFLREK